MLFKKIVLHLCKNYILNKYNSRKISIFIRKNILKMTKEQLQNRLDELELEFIQRKKEAIQEYCEKNNPYNVGDKFTDHNGSIIIEKINILYKLKSCVYNGIELKKDGTPKKSLKKRTALQIFDIKNNKNG